MSEIKYKSSFQDIYLTDDQYKLWLQKDANTYSAKCKVCSKWFSVAGQERKALDKYAKCLKHQQHFPNHNSTLKTAFTAEQTETDQVLLGSKQTSILSITENEAAKKADIMWTLEAVIAKHSFSSCDNKFEVFSSIFPDSQVGKTFAKQVVKQTLYAMA